jgi:hypothetical protein
MGNHPLEPDHLDVFTQSLTIHDATLCLAWTSPFEGLVKVVVEALDTSPENEGP